MNTIPVFYTAEGKNALHQYCDMLWAQVSFPYEKMNVETRFGSTSLIASGHKDAPPLVLLHGSSMSSVMWASDIKKLSKDYCVYAPDMPGEPGRSAEIQLPFDTADYPNWLTDVLNGLSIDKTAVVGASLGGWLAAKFAIGNPERVSKLALLCPAGIGSQNEAFKDIALALLSKGEQGIDELYAKMNGDEPIPEIMLNYQKLIAATFNTRKEAIPPFTDDELKSLSMPSAVFVGGKDILLNSAETAQRYKRLIPSATVVMMPERGHSLTGLTDEIKAFLTDGGKQLPSSRQAASPAARKRPQRER